MWNLCLIVNLPEDKGTGIFLCQLPFVIGGKLLLKEKKTFWSSLVYSKLGKSRFGIIESSWGLGSQLVYFMIMPEEIWLYHIY